MAIYAYTYRQIDFKDRSFSNARRSFQQWLEIILSNKHLTASCLKS